MDLIRRDTDYAMRALAYLAEHQTEGAVPTRALAQTQDIPPDFAHKIMGRLTRAGLVESRMGARGGFVLARDAEDITLLQVVEAMQGPVAVRKCLLGYDICPRRRSCQLSSRLHHIQRALVDLLRDSTLADILREGHPQLEHQRTPDARVHDSH